MQGQQIKRSGTLAGGWRFILGLLFCAALMASPASRAEGAVPRLSYDMPEQPNALPRVEFDAVVAEAREISQRTRQTRDTRSWPARWQHLDRARLAALWRMPEAAGLDESVRVVLLEQAAAWDMLGFERPSEAAALWARVQPRAPTAAQAALPYASGWTFGAQWSDEATALRALLGCYPAAAWAASGEASVWVVQHGGLWTQDWDGFRQCLSATVSDWPAKPITDRRRFEAVVAILKDKFTRELLGDGCGRSGPDSCLVVYDALYSLDRRNPRLPEILRRMQRDVDLDTPIVLTAAPAAEAASAAETPGKKKSKSAKRFAAQSEPLSAADAEFERRIIFLTFKLPVVLAQAQAWPEGELARVLKQAVELSVLSVQLQSLKRGRTPALGRYFNNPWQWLDAGNAASTGAVLQAAGEATARKQDCTQQRLESDKLPPAFWRGYALENFRLGRDACSSVLALGLPEVFQAAALAQDAGAAERELAWLAPATAALTKEGPARTEALDVVAAFCDASTHQRKRDPWQLCEGVTAREVARAVASYDSEQARRAAAAALLGPHDCPQDLVRLAAQALGYAGDAEFWSGQTTACRIKPDDPAQAIVALTYFEGDQLSGTASAPADDPGYSLDVVVVRVADGQILARLEKNHIDSDGFRFDGIAIDTANYALAPGTRGFGLRIAHAAHCYGCLFAKTDLTLYVQAGPRLEAVLDATVDETNGEADSSDCSALPTHTTRTLGVAPGASRGLADLRMRTSTRILQDAIPAGCKIQGSGNAVQTVTLHFDGERYGAPPGITLSTP